MSRPQQLTLRFWPLKLLLFICLCELFALTMTYVGLTLNSLYCNRDESASALRCQVGEALLGIEEWETRTPLAGTLRSAQVRERRNTRGNRSYAVELETSAGTITWAGYGISRFTAQTLTNQINTYLNDGPPTLQLKEPLEFSSIILVCIFLGVPYGLAYALRFERLFFDGRSQMLRFTRRGLFCSETHDTPFSHIRRAEVRTIQIKNNRNRITTNYQLELHCANNDHIVAKQVNKSSATHACADIVRFLAHYGVQLAAVAD
jgi:hypothetical protein